MVGRRFYASLFGLLFVGLALWAQTTEFAPVHDTLQRFHSVVYDLRLRATLADRPPDPRVVIVDIDEKSLMAEGHWPWARDRIAELVSELFAAGAVVVAFDVVFPEEERNSGTTVLERMALESPEDERLRERLEGQIARFDNNIIFAESLAQGDVVLGYVFDSGDHGASTGELPPALRVVPPEPAAAATIKTAPRYTANIPQLQQAARHGGFFSMQPDSDGLVRRAPLLLRHAEAIYGSLSLETLRVFLLIDEVEVETAQLHGETTIEAIRIGQVLIPTDGVGNVIVPYRGPQGSFPYISATDVLNGEMASEKLENAIVLIGTTAQGLKDLRATPVSGVFPGVEVHANILLAMLDGIEAVQATDSASSMVVAPFPSEPSWAPGANFALTLALGLFLALALPFLSSIWLIIVAIGAGAAATSLNIWFWSEKGLILSLAPQIFLVILLATFNATFGFLFESRNRRQLKEMFGQYVPPELVERMNQDPGNYDGKGEDRELTILFADIRSFTTISETLGAGRLKEMLNRFFTPMTEIIFNWRGTIDKYVGDMVMAFWGAPIEDVAHARHAISAALAMLEEVERLKPEFSRDGFPEINIGIGLNTGVVSVGDMGSRFRRAYTVLGDAVNLASRLEGTTKYYGVGLVVGETTFEQARDHFVFRELDRVRVKGKAQAITVYQPICAKEKGTPELEAELAAYREALLQYRNRQWKEAEATFNSLREQYPQTHIYALYLERIEDLRGAGLGEAWDGVYERRVK